MDHPIDARLIQLRHRNSAGFQRVKKQAHSAGVRQKNVEDRALN
jgi:hypothetical protein